jgi:hypothetical protein
MRQDYADMQKPPSRLESAGWKFAYSVMAGIVIGAILHYCLSGS